MLTRKEAVNQMIDNRNKEIVRNISDLLERVSDKIQIAINNGEGSVNIKMYEELDNIIALEHYLRDKGYYVKFYTYRFNGMPNGIKIPMLKIQWDLPWWRRLF
jgi:hypothetical protein